MVYIYISSQVKIQPGSPGNNYEKNYSEAEKIQKRNQEVEKQLDKRYKIRKHGCQYLSLITDLMTGNQNYEIRSIEQEFQTLVELHTGLVYSMLQPVHPVCPESKHPCFDPWKRHL